MPLGMILRRMWRERRLISVLLLAVCLVTGFFALSPLYVRAVSEAGVRYVVDNTSQEQLNLTLSNPEPLGQEAFDLLAGELSGVVTRIDRITRSSRVVGGFQYTLGRPTTLFTGRTPNMYQIVSYSNLEELFEVAEGRWPVRLATPDEVRPRAGMSADELSEAQLGVYSRGNVEAVITTIAAEESNLEVGNRITVGVEPERTAIVKIVGIVEPLIPLDDPFWEGQRKVVTGETVPIGLFDERYDFGLIVPEGAYTDWLADVTDGNTYIWRMVTNPDVIHADTLDALESKLGRVQSGLQTRYPEILVLSGLPSLITNFRAGLTATEGPIVLLSGAILVLMLYHLVTTVALVLEQQSVEWAAITSRGGSIAQLIGMQAFTMSILGLVGFVSGPFIAQGILLLLERFGPLARILNGASLGVRSLPVNAFVLSFVAAAASVVVLTLPAWPAARRSLLHLKQLISRPPTRPSWARYFLDGVFVLVGLGFMLRLYFMISGDLGGSLGVLLRDPAALIHLIASGAADTGGLNDPFNLLGPALFLTGAALFWLRVFPLLMRLLGRLFSRDQGLTLPMALWSVERDPGHYAQLVLLLIGTLSLGTASLALGATRDVGAWKVAQDETGAYVRLELDPARTDPTQDWLALPDVTSGAELLVTQTNKRAGRTGVSIIGIDPQAFGQTFPTLRDAVEPLDGLTAPTLPGQELPDDTSSLAVQVYAMPSEDEATSTNLRVQLLDALGVPLSLDMQTVEPTDAGRFVTYSAELPASTGRAPWRVVNLSIVSRRGELQDFSHEVYLDDLRAVSADGVETQVFAFESDDLDGWVTSSSHFQLPGDLSIARSEEQAAEGSASLRVDYRIRRIGGGMLEPQLAVNETPVWAVPVVVSESFADYYGRRSTRREPLLVGTEDTIDLDMPFGAVQMRYRVVGIIPDFPTLSSRDHFMVAWTDSLRPVLNSNASVRGYFDWNQVWLETADREPSVDFKIAAAGAAGVQDVSYAWERYNEIQRDPLPNALTGMLFAGFWVSLTLSILDFAFYLAVTARRRAISFAVLQAIGWESRNVWSLLAVEQAALVAPALLVGVGLGAALAYLLLPFLELVGSEALRFPVLDVLGLLGVLVLSFVLLLGATAMFLRRQKVNQVLRLGEE